ncbi:MAG TPA: peptidoglycan editing factor PgeF [Patescibacteria group bacterium]|nr:peptidoglycan editing factor PgeF [Patescibacteria group bacterium]
MQKFISMSQVHGNNVVLVNEKDAATIPACDGLITNSPDIALVVRVADCLPIFLENGISKSVGVLHAGWRGLESKIIEKAISLMNKNFKSKASDTIVYIGPHICSKHYEIKADVSAKFVSYTKAVVNKNGKIYLDLAQVAKEQLVKLGIKNKNIKIDKDCTFEDPELRSFRKGDKTGRSSYVFGLNIQSR